MLIFIKPNGQPLIIRGRNKAAAASEAVSSINLWFVRMLLWASLGCVAAAGLAAWILAY